MSFLATADVKMCQHVFSEASVGPREGAEDGLMIPALSR